MFSQLLEAQKKYGHGTHGYEKCAEMSRQAAASQPEYAAAYTLLAVLAEDFIDRTERMAVSSTETASAFAKYSDAVALLDKAYAAADATEILAALNTMAASIHAAD